MPRYFFDLHDGQEIRDTEGTNLASLSEVRDEAIGAAAQWLGDGAGHDVFWSGQPWKLIVRSVSGQIVLTLRLSASIEEGSDAPSV